MDYKDRKKIDFLCNQLLGDVDIVRLWPKLLENNVYNRDDVNIPNWQKNIHEVATIRDICATIKTRGPHAFRNFILSLKQSGHHKLAEELENYSTSNGNQSNNNTEQNVSSNLEEPATNFDKLSDASDEDEYSTDDYHTKLIKDFKPLTIKVRKASKFKDGPEIKDIERYPMHSTPRGYVLIITNVDYKVMKPRPSADIDRDNLVQLFEQMGFKTLIYNNLTGNEIKNKVKEFSKMKELHLVHSAFIIISSHGSGEHGKQETEIYGTDHQLSNYETVFCTDIIDYFTTERCPNLRKKPKIFIFQTCSNENKETQRSSNVSKNSISTNNLSKFSSEPNRGDDHQKAISKVATDTVVEDFPDTNKPYELSTRNYEDTLIAYATLPGYVSYRDRYNGSWFIQILCEVFMNYAYEKHVQDLFLMTDSRLKDLRTANNKCQTLWVINQGFNKHCYLNPGLFHKPTK